MPYLRRHDDCTSNLVRDLGTEILTNNVQTEVNPGGAAGRRQNVAVIDVENSGVDLHPRITRRQLVRVLPVRRRRTVIQESSGSQDERARTQRQNPRPAGMGAAKRGDEVWIRGVTDASHRNDDRVRLT